MKVSIKVLEIDHEHLVSLFSTALYGSDYLVGQLPTSDEDVEKHEDECWEDIAARHLLKGGSVLVRDENSEGEAYSSLGTVDDKSGVTTYKIKLGDIIDGLNKAANGTFKVNDIDEEAAAREYFFDFYDNEGNLDCVGADYLMQIILFGEVVYG